MDTMSIPDDLSEVDFTLPLTKGERYHHRLVAINNSSGYEIATGRGPLSEKNSDEIVRRCNAHNDLVAELERRKARDESNHWATMHAAGFGALLSEILGSGCLTRERHRDLYDRVRQAADDHENHIRAALAKVAA